MEEDRLSRQVEFLAEIDKLKTVFRRAYLLADPDRRENSAEHSWHVAMLAFILVEYSQDAIDLDRVIRMLLVHDIVEIDAGDTGIYDTVFAASKTDRENQAAVRIFDLLPPDQCKEISLLWEEYEKGMSGEARFARAVDRLMPLIHNYYNCGKRWKEDGITLEQVLEVNQVIRESSPRLWEFALYVINECTARGFLPKGSE